MSNYKHFYGYRCGRTWGRLGGAASALLMAGLWAGCVGSELPKEGGEDVAQAKQTLTNGGFVVVSGDDADDAGHCQGTMCGGLYPKLLHEAVAKSGSPGAGILAIGLNANPALSSFNGWNNPVNGGPGAPVTIVTTLADIASVNFEIFAVIYLPSANTQTGGGLSGAQINAINARQPDFATFVNVKGGSLMALTQAGAVGAWGFLPLPLTTQNADFQFASPTADLLDIVPTVTNANLSHCCFHNVFTGPAGYSGLEVFAINNHVGTTGFGLPVILGGAKITAENCTDGQDNDGDGDVDGDDDDCWVCGDGDVDPGEQCDDDNTSDGDLCSASCQFEQSPPVAVCQDITTCTSPGLCSAVVDNLGAGSFDPDGDPITITQSPPGPYSVGQQSVQVTVSDGALEDQCQANITVQDCEPPALTCPSDFQVECTGNGQALVTPPSATATDNCAGANVSAPPPASLPLGSTPLTYTATDAAGNTAQCTTTVTVVDTTPPVVSVTPPSALWPPNHKYQVVSLADCGIVVQDQCGGVLDPTVASATITCVTSDEPEDSRSDGNSNADIVILNGTTVKLRSERKGDGDGRVYEIHFQVTDTSGNVTEGICPVSVPHDRSGAPAIDSGDAYQVCK